MIGLLWEQETCGTLSLDFPVLAKEEIAYGTRTQRGDLRCLAQCRP